MADRGPSGIRPRPVGQGGAIAIAKARSCARWMRMRGRRACFGCLTFGSLISRSEGGSRMLHSGHAGPAAAGPHASCIKHQSTTVPHSLDLKISDLALLCLSGRPAAHLSLAA